MSGSAMLNLGLYTWHPFPDKCSGQVSISLSPWLNVPVDTIWAVLNTYRILPHCSNSWLGNYSNTWGSCHSAHFIILGRILIGQYLPRIWGLSIDSAQKYASQYTISSRVARCRILPSFPDPDDTLWPPCVVDLEGNTFDETTSPRDGAWTGDINNDRQPDQWQSARVTV